MRLTFVTNRFFLKTVNQVEKRRQDQNAAQQQRPAKRLDRFLLTSVLGERQIASAFQDNDIGKVPESRGKEDHRHLETRQRP